MAKTLRWMTSTFVISFLMAVVGLQPVQAQVKDFNVPAQSATTGIPEFARQAGIQILVSEPLVRGKKVAAVTGAHSVQAGLAMLLKGTGLAATTKDGATYTVAPTTKTSSIGTAATASNAGAMGPVASSTGEVPVPNPSSPIPEILVTGSRILNLDVTRTENDTQPYTIFTAQTIEQSGAASIEDFLKQQLTMNTVSATSSQASGANGALGTTSSINLRGLGTNETLILIDGRRSASVNWAGSAFQPDINGIPLSAIERIEVLPASASAIYGGAAVGGVVNIILKKKFDGGDLRVTYDNTTGTNAPLRTVSGVYGFTVGDGRTRVMLAGSYSNGDPLLEEDRAGLMQRGISDILNNSPSFLYNPSNPFPGATPNIAGLDANYNPANLILKDGTPLNCKITSIPAGTAPGSNLSAALLANACKYNLNLAPGTQRYGLQSSFGAVPTTKSLTATIRQEFSPVFEGFTEFSTQSNASSATDNPISSALVPSTSSANPFQNNIYITFPSGLNAPATTSSVTQSVTVGGLAHFGGGWSSELDYTWSRSSFISTDNSVDGAFYTDMNSGVINPFVDTLAYPLNLSKYLDFTNFSAASTLNDLNFRAAGQIGSLPAGRPTITIGLEHRKEGTDDSPISTYSYVGSQPMSLGEQIFFGQAQSTNSVYAESLIPVISHNNALPLLQALEVQLAGRTESYTVHTGTPYVSVPPNLLDPPQGVHDIVKYTSINKTFGFKLKPIEDVTLRASYSTAFLPPTAQQFLPNPVPICGFPCAPVTDPKNGETYLVDEITGGNSGLQPQTSRDWEFGMIWEPQEQVLHGLRVNVEHYSIAQPNYITNPTLQQVVSDPALAGRVIRDPVTGLITDVNVSYLNATLFETAGWDLKIDYRKPTDIGTFALHAAGTVISHDNRQYTIQAALVNYAGYPADGGEAKIKGNATLDWEYHRWTLGWTSTYFGMYNQYGTPGSPSAILYAPNTYYSDAQGSTTIPHQIYHSLFAGYNLPTHSLGPVSNLSIRFIINNVFNTLPPFDAYSAPYYYSTYGDARLRHYQITLRAGF